MSNRFGFEFRVAANAYFAWREWLLGHPDQALQVAGQAIAALDGEKHLYTVSRAYYWISVPYQMRGDWAIVRKHGKLARKLGKEHGFAMLAAAGRIMEGAAHAALGGADAGIAAMRRGLDAYGMTGARFQRPYHLVLLAEALLRAGQMEEAFAALVDAENLIDETGERFYEADVHRVRGGLLLVRGRTQRSEAIQSFRAALDIAKAQGARSLQLRAARDLAQLLAEGGERPKARKILAPIFATFTEGLGTADLVTSRAVLDAL